jgi:hypothetical protein
MKSKLHLLFVMALSTSIFLVSCKKNDENPQGTNYEVPVTYNFPNVNYSGQTARLDMLGELENEMKKGNTAGTVVSAETLKKMYANEDNPFSSEALNTSGKQLKDKAFSLDRALFEGFFDQLEAASTSSVPGSNGVAGVVISNDGTKAYLFDENGVEYTQVVLKGLMGAVFYYQVVGTYLSEDKIGNHVDNSTVKEGEGTPMEHHWDEAFGYFGVPVDFPANKDGIRYFGRYSDQVNSSIGSNEKLMNAYIKGRAGISNKDMETKDAQAAILIEEWENLVAASVILELNKAKTAFADDAQRNHFLSEAIGFILALKYNPDRRISQNQIDNLLGLIWNNLYEISLNDINQAIDLVSTIYGLDSVKNTLN